MENTFNLKHFFSFLTVSLLIILGLLACSWNLFEKDIFQRVNPAIVAGTTKFKLNITPDGSTQIAIPIKVPPGTNQMQPKLNIGYNSRLTSGIMGQGFSLHGLQKISRVGATLAEDGFQGGVQYDLNDRFSLNEKRLIKINSAGSSYGHSGSVYHTAKESWTKVQALDSSGVGPLSFEVTLKAGIKLRFGSTADSRVLAQGLSGRQKGSVREWLLSEITDLNGNSQLIQYTSQPKDLNGKIVSGNTGYSYPQSIEYTINTGQKGNRKVLFCYESRQDTARIFQGSAFYSMHARLTSISTYHYPTPLDSIFCRQYGFDYDSNSPLGSSRIATITERDSVGNTLPPLGFNWTDGPNSFTSNLIGSTGLSSNEGWQGDFNGDGLTDILARDSNSAMLYSWNRRTFIATDTIPVLNSYNFVGDFNGDGLDDFFSSNLKGGTLYYSNGSTFGSGTPLGPWRLNRDNYTGDFNGDGKMDLLTSDGINVNVFLAKSSGFESPIPVQNLNLAQGKVWVADFNGDGLSDVFSSNSFSGDMYFSDFSKGKNFSTGISIGNLDLNLELTFIGDFNGDKLPDFFTSEGSSTFIYYSNGKGFVKMTIRGVNVEQGSTWIGDFNGDGMMDIYSKGPSKGNVYYSNGYGFRSQPISNYTLSQNSSWIGDYNGDGASDFFSLLDNDSIYYAGSSLTTNNKPNLLIGIDNHIGGQISINYEPLTNPLVYQKGNQAINSHVEALHLFNSFSPQPLSPVQVQIGPVKNIQNALYVVDSYVKKSQDVKYSNSFRYGGALFSLDGFGWLGMANKTKIDLAQNLTKITHFAQPFPLTGNIDSLVLLQSSDGKVLMKKQKVFQVNNPISGRKIISQVLKMQQKEQHFSNGKFAFSLESHYKYDDFGNQRQLTYLGDSKEKNFIYTFRNYSNDTSLWQIGYPISERITLDSLGHRVIQHDSIIYDNSKNLQKRLTWDDSQELWLTEEFGHDNWGNQTFFINTSGDTTKHVINSSTYYTFPSQIISPPNQQNERLTQQFKYDMRFGIKTHHTNQNGHLIYREIDNFGRVQKVYGPNPQGSGDPVLLFNTSWKLGSKEGLIKSIATPVNWSEKDMLYTKKTYDPWANNIRISSIGTSRGDTLQVSYVDRTYDSQGKLINNSQPYLKGSNRYWITRKRDPFGRITRIKHPKEFVDSTVTNIIYDGKRVTTIKAAGTPDEVATHAIHGFFNYRKKIVLRISGEGDTTRNYYDVTGRLVGVVSPLKDTTSLSYNSVNRITSRYQTHLGEILYDYNDKERTVSTTISTNNSVETAQFDALTRPILETTSWGDKISYQYDQKSTVNSNGKLSSVSIMQRDSTFSYSYGYDLYGNKNSELLSIAGHSFLTKYQYTPRKHLKKIVYPDSSSLSYLYNGNSFLDSIIYKTPLASTVLYFGDDFTGKGLPGRIVAGNKSNTNYKYFSDGSPATISLEDVNSNVLVKQKISRDYLNRVRQINDSIGGNNLSFRYNLNGQLDSVCSKLGTSKYSYHMSNLIGIDTLNFVFERNQLMYTIANANDTIEAFEYNEVGTMKSRVTKTDTFKYGYDGKNYLRTISKNGKTIQVFNYDHLGRRILKSNLSNNILSIYPNGLYVNQDSVKHVTKTVQFAGQAGVVGSYSTSRDSRYLYFHKDHNGSTTLTTDSAGKKSTEISYFPFGGIQIVNGPDNFSPKYGGKEFDSETGLYYFSYRYYNPVAARFISPDDRPGGKMNQFGTLNRYSFTLNDPVNFQDPTGHNIFLMILQYLGQAILETFSDGAATPELVALDVEEIGAEEDIENAVTSVEEEDKDYEYTGYSHYTSSRDAESLEAGLDPSRSGENYENDSQLGEGFYATNDQEAGRWFGQQRVDAVGGQVQEFKVLIEKEAWNSFKTGEPPNDVFWTESPWVENPEVKGWIEDYDGLKSKISGVEHADQMKFNPRVYRHVKLVRVGVVQDEAGIINTMYRFFFR